MSAAGSVLPSNDPSSTASAGSIISVSAHTERPSRRCSPTAHLRAPHGLTTSASPRRRRRRTRRAAIRHHQPVRRSPRRARKDVPTLIERSWIAWDSPPEPAGIAGMTGGAPRPSAKAAAASGHVAPASCAPRMDDDVPPAFFRQPPRRSQFVTEGRVRASVSQRSPVAPLVTTTGSAMEDGRNCGCAVRRATSAPRRASPGSALTALNNFARSAGPVGQPSSLGSIGTTAAYDAAWGNRTSTVTGAGFVGPPDRTRREWWTTSPRWIFSPVTHRFHRRRPAVPVRRAARRRLSPRLSRSEESWASPGKSFSGMPRDPYAVAAWSWGTPAPS
jgi:hypothetical protein